MKLTTELLAEFLGGQMEMQNPLSRHLYRGQLKSAIVTDSYELSVTFDWLAQGVGYPTNPLRFVAVHVTPLTWQRSMEPFTVFDIGKDGIRLTSGIGHESVFLFLPNYFRNIDPAKVEGLAVGA